MVRVEALRYRDIRQRTLSMRQGPEGWIPAVPVASLHERLGFLEQLSYPDDSLNRPLTEWYMERDDAPILRYLYRNFKPTRHLEFGTWEGTGTVYCLLECGATVWTVNLLAGELTAEGDHAYYHRQRTRRFDRKDLSKRESERRFLQELPDAVATGPSADVETVVSDSVGSIGRFYLEAGLGHRVCQIYSDSREWDTSAYPHGFFDSAFIDGGHEASVTESDTLKSLELVRTGGLVMWHDYCPDASVRSACGSTVGVGRAIRHLQRTLEGAMSDLFWVEPSWLLVGIRA